MLIKHVLSHFTKFVKTRFLAQKSGSQLRCRTMLKMLWNIQKTPPKHVKRLLNFLFYPSALRAGGVLSSRSGRAGGCQTCGTHISVTAWWIFSIRSSVELSRPVGVHCHGHMPICPIWACPWAKNLSNLPQIGSRLCGMHISETAGWIYPI